MGIINDLCVKIERRVGRTEVNPIARFKVIQGEKRLRAHVKQLMGRETLAPKDVPLVPSNWGYGHEYWFKRYAGYEGDIFATIEHGVYFGNQSLGYGNPIHEEWQIGSIITYGEYRRRLLETTYPHNHVYTVGPYINYAPTDETFLSELCSRIDCTKRTLTLFPAHSIETVKRAFDHDSLIKHTSRFAKEVECVNKMVCLSSIDFESALAKKYYDAGFEVVSCGPGSPAFLPRQRAIFELSDVTLSNDLGTHVGYALALGKPHYAIDPIGLDMVDETLADLDVDVLRAQKEEFAFTFKADKSCSISQAQNKFVDYFWGLSEQKSSSEILDILRECESYGKEYSESKHLWVQAGSEVVS